MVRIPRDRPPNHPGEKLPNIKKSVISTAPQPESLNAH
jgi:hypothetical protein